MIVLSLDPSSTRTGYAVMADALTIIDAGLLNSDPTDAWLVRVKAIVRDLGKLLNEHCPDVILVEVPHQHNKASHKNLAVYGFAVGVMWWECYSFTEETHAINAEEWTGKVPKRRRQQNIRMVFPHRYIPALDKGGDIADAIGMALWWFGQQKAKRMRT